MAGEGVRIEGLRETVRDLERLGAEVDDLKDVMADISSAGVTEVVARAPRQSGTLVGTARGNRAKGKAIVTVGRASVPYAGVIAFGWPARNIKANGYITAAVDHLSPRVPEMFEDGIQRVIRKLGLQ